jgi:hypothetical protein
MTAPSVRLIKFDADSPTDRVLARLQSKLCASSTVEAMRRSLTIIDKITDLSEKGQKFFVQEADGKLRELPIS